MFAGPRAATFKLSEMIDTNLRANTADKELVSLHLAKLLNFLHNYEIRKQKAIIW